MTIRVPQNNGLITEKILFGLNILMLKKHSIKIYHYFRPFPFEKSHSLNATCRALANAFTHLYSEIPFKETLFEHCVNFSVSYMQDVPI